MKTKPTDEEAAAIAAALLRYAALAAPAPTAANADSSWRERARREGVLSSVPPTWRG